jgi:hypothetical protein
MAGGSADGAGDGAPETARDVSWRMTRSTFVAAAILLAFSNIVFGLLFRRDWVSGGDFELVMSWSRAWLEGVDVYGSPDAMVDYAPMGIVLLSPVAALPPATAVAVWTMLHVALSIALAIMATKLAAFGRERTLLVVLLLALPPFRVPLQFSLLCFVLALAGFLVASRSPVWSGVAIGLSLFKPQIGGPALIWAIASRRWRTAGTALVTAAALVAIYAARVARSPLTVMADWWPSLARKQNQRGLGFGDTNLQPWLAWSGVSPVTLQIVTAIVLSAALVWIVLRRRELFDLRMFAAACLVSLLAVRHLSYDLILAIPALVFALSRANDLVRALGVVALAVLIASPPAVWRALEGGPPELWGLMPFMMHAYRAAAAALFLCVLFARGSERLQSTSRASR